MRNAALSITATDWKINPDGSANVTLRCSGSFSDENGAMVLREPYIIEAHIPAQDTGGGAADRPAPTAGRRGNDPRRGGAI